MYVYYFECTTTRTCQFDPPSLPIHPSDRPVNFPSAAHGAVQFVRPVVNQLSADLTLLRRLALYLHGPDGRSAHLSGPLTFIFSLRKIKLPSSGEIVISYVILELRGNLLSICGIFDRRRGFFQCLFEAMGHLRRI